MVDQIDVGSGLSFGYDPMSSVSAVFPVLPAPTGSVPTWPSTILSAHRFIHTTCEQAWRLCRLNNGDSARLKVVKGTIETECVQTLEDMEIHGVPVEYIDQVLDILVNTVIQMEDMIDRLRDRFV